MSNPGYPRVVIIGCGFGGLEAARALKGAPVEITLVDKTNHHLFQPLLYQVATAGLSAPAIAAPVRHLFRKQDNVTTLLGEVTTIDTQRRQVLLDGSALPYDHLIVACGAAHSYFGHDEWERHAPGLKTLDDAFEIRRRILLAFEAAEKEGDNDARAAWLTFVVIGGGPTGVEMAGTMAEIARHTLPGEFRHIDPATARILLLEGGARLLQAMPEDLSRRAREQLEKLGVEVRLKAQVTAIDSTRVEVRPGAPTEGAGASYTIDSRCVIWAAGVAASPLGRQLAQATGAECDRAGRLVVEPDLSVPGHPEITVIGDLAAANSHVPGRAPEPVPGVSPAAKQMGGAAAANLLRRLAGQATRPFRYRNYGNLATIGRNAAVVDLMLPSRHHIKFSGYPAWLFWLFAHIYFLIGFRNRIVVLIDWASAYWSQQRYARVVTDIAGRTDLQRRTP
ncbi:MAG TPA: NAD(P)/FAD-dependent oxidoreductase [Ramlibacter sp.]|nr:NAD(P)/FAD-dependent oxidoreductase [Ramlibacter sp.]